LVARSYDEAISQQLPVIARRNDEAIAVQEQKQKRINAPKGEYFNKHF
jgi:hypothetical protein